MQRLLAYEVLGSGPPLIFLHGLYGAGRNWRQIARRFADSFTCLLPDARNHGRSFWAEAMDYASMAQDLKQLLTQQGAEPAILVGHSMGGKTAMAFAERFPDALRGLVVVDVAARAYPVQLHQQLIESLLSLKLDSLASRQAADHYLQPLIPEPKVRQFLLMALVQENGRWRWRNNLEVLHKSLSDLTGALPMPAQPLEPRVPVLVVGGSESSYIVPTDWCDFERRFSDWQLLVLPQAGHWVHTEQPAAFEECLRQFIRSKGRACR